MARSKLSESEKAEIEKIALRIYRKSKEITEKLYSISKRLSA